jgi:hypothetical protein
MDEIVRRILEAGSSITIAFGMLGILTEFVTEKAKAFLLKLNGADKFQSWVPTTIAFGISMLFGVLMAYEMDIRVTELVFGTPAKHIAFEYIFTGMLGSWASGLVHDRLRQE